MEYAERSIERGAVSDHPVPRIDHTVLRAQIAAVLEAWGLTAESREVVADVMVETDLSGVDSHGIAMLPVYDDKRAAGVLNVAAVPRVVADAPAYATVDADGGLGHFAGVTAMRLAVAKAKENGVGMVVVRNSRHFGAAGYYARLAAVEGLVGLTTTSTTKMSVLPTNGTRPLLGTNPIAFAAPGDRHEPFVLDMSTSTVASNKVRAYAYRDRPLPDGWVVDEHAEPVTEAARALTYLGDGVAGGLHPLGGDEVRGGHKGYGLAVMVHLLSATLAGADFSPTRTAGAAENIGHFMLAIDPVLVRGDDSFGTEVDEVLRTLESSPPARPDRPVLVAGAPEAASRAERLRHGIPVPPALLAAVEDIASRAGAEFLLARASRGSAP